MAEPGSFVTLANAAEIPAGSFKAVTAQGKHLLVCHAGAAFYVIDDTCTHDDGPLADGWLEGTQIECPRHGARFDITCGRVICLPAAVPINSYRTVVDGGEVKADLNAVLPK